MLGEPFGKRQLHCVARPHSTPWRKFDRPSSPTPGGPVHEEAVHSNEGAGQSGQPQPSTMKRVILLGTIFALCALKLGAATPVKTNATVIYDEAKNEWQIEVTSTGTDTNANRSLPRVSSAKITGVLGDKEKKWKWSVVIHGESLDWMEQEVRLVPPGGTADPFPERHQTRGYGPVQYTVDQFPLGEFLFAAGVDKGIKVKFCNRRGTNSPIAGDADFEIDKSKVAAAAHLAEEISGGRIEKKPRQTIAVDP